jgi:hypothetical protein
MNGEAADAHPIPPTRVLPVTGPAACGDHDILSLAAQIKAANQQAAAEYVSVQGCFEPSRTGLEVPSTSLSS